MECHKDETQRFDNKFVNDDASETIVNKENLNIGDGGARGVENSTISHMELHAQKTGSTSARRHQRPEG